MVEVFNSLGGANCFRHENHIFSHFHFYWKDNASLYKQFFKKETCFG